MTTTKPFPAEEALDILKAEGENLIAPTISITRDAADPTRIDIALQPPTTAEIEDRIWAALRRGRND